MSSFDPAIQVVLVNEGGFVSNPKDPGGATKYGISLRYLRAAGKLGIEDLPDGDIDQDGDIDVDDIHRLTPEQAKAIYRAMWNKYLYGNIAHQMIATKVFDSMVNMGPRSAHKCLQRGLRASGRPVKVDGLLGPHTLGAVNVCDSTRLVSSMRSEVASVHRIIVAKKPDMEEFLAGWLNRSYQ